jgi:hypothetical protein
VAQDPELQDQVAHLVPVVLRVRAERLDQAVPLGQRELDLEHRQLVSQASVQTPQDQDQQAVVAAVLEQPVLLVREAREASLGSQREPNAKNLSKEKHQA